MPTAVMTVSASYTVSCPLALTVVTVSTEVLPETERTTVFVQMGTPALRSFSACTP